MAYSQDTRDKLRQAYIYGGLTLELAAAQTGVPVSTATRWKREAADRLDNWDKHRAAVLIAGGGIEDVTRMILLNTLTETHVTMDKIRDDPSISAADRVDMLARLGDSFSKCIAASKKVLPETSELATAMSTVTLFSNFINESYPKHRAAFAEVIEAFGKVLEKKYG
ncbi:DUF1804 family protein [Serratia marcescens]|uniref:DUF1804 family protein n=1 Tax=Serratia marcescens TaxID=615 RepID=A0A5C7C0S9_SERMA|nr:MULTISPECIES: DUF1804 family protein [Serratia]TXE27138.1 DUF1804 family protein [Serratia marcescens]TXE55305.1 DUF1804 family protein [Serratia marcescens]